MAEREMLTAPCLTVAQVAEILNVHRSIVYRLINGGSLACYRIKEGTIRIGRHHLAEYLERAECHAQEQTENGPSSDDEDENSGTPTETEKDGLSGFRSEQRMRSAQDKLSKTSGGLLTLVRS